MTMQRKTIRPNTWETNSSSTSATTLLVYENKVPDMKPYSSAGNIMVPIRGSYDYETWGDKMALLGTYLVLQERESELDRVEKIITDFAGIPVKYDRSGITALIKYGVGTDRIEGEFWLFTKSQWDKIPITDFIESVEKILATDEMILAFICSTGWFDCSEYYDG